MHTLNALLDVLASTPAPRPRPTIAPAEPVQVAVGEVGEWFGPVLVFAAAFGLDWSALGSHSLRDKIAMLGYYAGTVSAISIFEWEDDVQGWFDASWSWNLTGAVIASVLHLCVLLAMFGTRIKWLSGLGKRVCDLAHIDSKDSSANRINTTLMMWSIAAGASSVLARGPSAGPIHWLGTLITGLWGWLANGLITLHGG